MRVVVIGASVAGVTTAEALRAAGHDGEVVLVGDEPHAPYARPPLSKQVLDGTWEPERAALRTAAELHALDVDLRTGARATAVDTGSRTVVVDGAPLAYDALVVATGVGATRPDVPGIERARVLRTLDDAVGLRAAMRTARRTVVVGSGVLGSELASAVRHADRDVTIVGRSGALTFGTVGALLSDRLAALHRGHGVDLALGVGLRAVGEGTVVLGDGTELAADLVVAATGGRPRTGWLSGSGLSIDDGVLCDEQGRAAPGVWAVGDVARWSDPVTGRAVRIEHQTNAIEQALVVAGSITGTGAATAATPFFWSEVHDTRIQAYGTFDTGRPLEVLSGDDGGAAGGAADGAAVDGRGAAAAAGSGAGAGTGAGADTAGVLGQYRTHSDARGDDDRPLGIVGWHAARAFRRTRVLVDDARADARATVGTSA